MKHILYVFHDNNSVGQITLDEKRRWVFKYDVHWLNHPNTFPISIQLPLQESAFDPDHAKPFFANLLPEGEVRRLIAEKMRVSESNDFELLSFLGGDCAGALSVNPENKIVSKKGHYREISDVELERLISNSPRRPLLIADQKSRMSLAGAQEKLPVWFNNGKIFIPEDGAPSAYILKPPMPHYEDSVQNEAFCMQLALNMGLPVAPVSIIRVKEQPVLLITRYDREFVNIETLKRLHQEDFCQALGLLPGQKYQSDGGPSFSDCFDVLENKSSDPALDKMFLIQWAFFNFMIGNCDAHAKNISLIIRPDSVRLAPFYDLLSTVVYEDLDEKMAMKIGDHYDRKTVFKRHWERFANNISIKQDLVFFLLKDFSDRLPVAAEKLASDFVKKHGGEKTIQKIVKSIKIAAKQL